MDKYTIKSLILENFPSADVLVEGEDGKYNAIVTCSDFSQKNTIDRHKMIYEVLNPYISSGEIHAISLKTYDRDEK